MAIDNPNWDTRLVEQNGSAVTLNASNSWTVLDTSNSFTTSVTAPIKINYNLIHHYEQGATNCSYILDLMNPSNSSVIASSHYMQVAKQGQGANMAYGAHFMHWTFYNVPAGTYQIRVRGRNMGNSGTQHITNYFAPNVNQQDQLVITYQA